MTFLIALAGEPRVSFPFSPMRRCGEKPTFVNLAGLTGWLASGRLFRRTRLARWQLALFKRLLPIVRLEGHLRLPIGLGLYAHATR